jgi:tetratricopeptide (TPR) repeat protein
MNTNTLIDLVDRGFQAEQQFVAGLSEAEREADGTLERWTARDIIAHNSYWRMHHAKNLMAVLDGKEPIKTEDFDHANADIYHQYQDKSWEAVEVLANDSRKLMNEAVMALGEKGLQQTDLLPWQKGLPIWRELVGNAYTHPIIHLAEWYIRKGDNARAAGLYQEMTGSLADLDSSPDWLGTIRYNLACSYSLLGEATKAIETLLEALKLNPALLEWSKQDPDFEPIRGESAYLALYD